MTLIYHLAEPAHWAAALESGSYSRSTRGRTMAQEGFIHCSSAQQWPVVRRAFYGDYPQPLLLLTIDEEKLSEPAVREVGNPATGEVFPHLYAALDPTAVVDVTELLPPHGGGLEGEPRADPG